MKRMAALLCATVFLCSCKDTLDQTLSKGSFKDDLKTIKEKHGAEYTPADFAALQTSGAKKLTAQVMGFNTGELPTYRALLDTVKAERLRDEAAAKAYGDALAKMKAALDISVSRGVYLDVNGIPAYMLWLTIKNGSPETISAMEGTITMRDPLGHELHTHDVKYIEDLPGGAEVKDDSRLSVLLASDDVSTLQQLDFEQIKFEWNPQQLVFASGTKMTAPKAPTARL